MTGLSKLSISLFSGIIIIIIALTSCQRIHAFPNHHSHHHDHHDVSSHETSQTQIENNDESIITLPLMNHQQFIERLRRERRLTPEQEGSQQDDENEHASDSDHESASATDEKDGHDTTATTNTTHALSHAELYQGIGTHYVDLWVGTPNPQRQTLIIDTGSDITAFPCDPCRDCGHDSHTDLEYNKDLSSTFHFSQCDACWLGTCQHDSHSPSYCSMQMAYAEGSSWVAYEAKDWVYLGGRHDSAEQRRLLDDDSNGVNDYGNDKDEDDVKIKANSGMGMLRNMQNGTQELEEAFMKEAKDAEHASEEKHEKNEGKDYASAKDYSFELGFGCQHTITGLFKSQLADGIMGMENSPRSFWQQMYDANMISSKAFALCFTHAEECLRSGTDAGAVTLGGMNADMHTSPMVYAESIDFNGWYGVRVNAVYLKFDGDDGEDDEGGEVAKTMVKLDLDLDKTNSKGIIIDSGTTESYFSAFMSLPFKTSFEELMGFNFDSMIKESNDINPHTDYPTIVIQLRSAPDVKDDDLMDGNGHPLVGLANEIDLDHPNDVLLEIPPRNYMMWSESANAWTNRFHMTEHNDYGVIGANSMVGHDILFDVDKKQIGFAKSDCVF